MSSADAASLAGKWLLDGVPAPSGTATLSATMVDLPQGRYRLILPVDLRPAAGSGDVVLEQQRPGVYTTRTRIGSDVTLTITSPGHARLSILGKSTFSKFEVLLTQVRG